MLSVHFTLTKNTAFISHILVAIRKFSINFALSNREVPEWLKGPAWKAGIGATLSRVRIPSSLLSVQNQRIALVFLFIICVTVSQLPFQEINISAKGDCSACVSA